MQLNSKNGIKVAEKCSHVPNNSFPGYYYQRNRISVISVLCLKTYRVHLPSKLMSPISTTKTKVGIKTITLT